MAISISKPDNLQHYRDTIELYSGEYWGAFDEADELNGIFAQFWNGNLMTQAPDLNVLDTLTTHFCEVVNRPVAGMIGDSDQTSLVLGKFDFPASAYDTNRSEGLYQLALEDLQLCEKASGDQFSLILTSEADELLLFDWLKAYELEAFGGEASEDHDEHITIRVTQMQESGNAWVLLDSELPVALSGFNATLSEIVQVGPVWTPPEYRNKGYARAVVALTLKAVKEKGVPEVRSVCGQSSCCKSL